MKSILFCFLVLICDPLFSQNQDIEIIEERTESTIKLSAKNTTDQSLDMVFNFELTGFTSNASSPIKKVLLPNSTEYLVTLTASPDVNNEYKTSVSYKKLADNSKPVAKTNRMTGIQINEVKVNVFTQDGCARCAYVISYLEKNGIPFVELNTSIHQPNQDLMFEKLEKAGFKGTSVQMPVVLKNGKLDYDIKDLQAYVKKLQ